MRVLFLLGSLNRGGTETLVLDILRNATKYDFNVSCIYRIKGGAIENDFLNSDFHIDYIPYKGKSFFKYIISLRKYVLKNKITLLHAHQPIDALYSWLACLGLKIPVFLSLHGYDFNYSRTSMSILKFSLTHTNMNLYVSETQRKYYIEKFKLNESKQKVVYNCIDFTKFSSVDKNSIENLGLRQELSIDKNKLLIITVGNFNEVRDQYTICEFLKLLKTKYDDFHLIFVGGKINSNPQIYDKCFQFCEENNLMSNVSFLGTRNDVPQLLKQSDLFLYSTNCDTFGIAVIEAMFTETPVFVNNWDVMSEITNNGQFATLYNTKDKFDLLEKFELFLQNKELYFSKAKRAKEYVTFNYNTKNHISRLESVYTKFNFKQKIKNI